MFLDSPEHDEYSHYADGLRYMAVGLKRYSPPKEHIIAPQRQANTAGFSI